jgi:hypothetical protein
MERAGKGERNRSFRLDLQTVPVGEQGAADTLFERE